MNIQNTRIGEARLIMRSERPKPRRPAADGDMPESGEGRRRPRRMTMPNGEEVQLQYRRNENAADSREDDDLQKAPTHVKLDGESIPLGSEAVSRIDRLREAIYRKRDVFRRAETLLQKIYEKIGEAYGREPEEMIAHIKAGTDLRETPEAEEAYKKVEKWIELLDNFSAQNPAGLAATATQLEADIGERAQHMNDALAQNPTMTYNEDSMYVKKFEESLALHQQKVDRLENILNTYESAATLRTAADQLWESPDFRGVRGPDPNRDPWIKEQFEKWQTWADRLTPAQVAHAIEKTQGSVFVGNEPEFGRKWALDYIKGTGFLFFRLPPEEGEHEREPVVATQNPVETAESPSEEFAHALEHLRTTFTSSTEKENPFKNDQVAETMVEEVIHASAGLQPEIIAHTLKNYRLHDANGQLWELKYAASGDSKYQFFFEKSEESGVQAPEKTDTIDTPEIALEAAASILEEAKESPERLSVQEWRDAIEQKANSTGYDYNVTLAVAEVRENGDGVIRITLNEDGDEERFALLERYANQPHHGLAATREERTITITIRNKENHGYVGPEWDGKTTEATEDDSDAANAFATDRSDVAPSLSEASDTDTVEVAAPANPLPVEAVRAALESDFGDYAGIFKENDLGSYMYLSLPEVQNEHRGIVVNADTARDGAWVVSWSNNRNQWMTPSAMCKKIPPESGAAQMLAAMKKKPYTLPVSSHEVPAEDVTPISGAEQGETRTGSPPIDAPSEAEIPARLSDDGSVSPEANEEKADEQPQSQINENSPEAMALKREAIPLLQKALRIRQLIGDHLPKEDIQKMYTESDLTEDHVMSLIARVGIGMKLNLDKPIEEKDALGHLSGSTLEEKRQWLNHQLEPYVRLWLNDSIVALGKVEKSDTPLTKAGKDVLAELKKLRGDHEEEDRAEEQPEATPEESAEENENTQVTNFLSSLVKLDYTQEAWNKLQEQYAALGSKQKKSIFVAFKGIVGRVGADAVPPFQISLTEDSKKAIVTHKNHRFIFTETDITLEKIQAEPQKADTTPEESQEPSSEESEYSEDVPKLFRDIPSIGEIFS